MSSNAKKGYLTSVIIGITEINVKNTLNFILEERL